MAEITLDKTLKATVVSILPFKIYEHKPTVYCSTLPARIPKADWDKKQVVVFHVADGFRYEYVPEMMRGNSGGQDHKKIAVPASEIAVSICDDYIAAKMAFMQGEGEDDGVGIPGLLPLNEVVTVEDVKTKHADKLEKLFAQQTKWFNKLVYLADDEWQRSRSHKMVTDEQRIAARCLKLDRDWAIDASKAGFVKCTACKQSIDSEAIICAFCRAIVRPEAYKKIQFADLSPKG